MQHALCFACKLEALHGAGAGTVAFLQHALYHLSSHSTGVTGVQMTGDFCLPAHVIIDGRHQLS